MPLFITSLNSGSNGNCYYVGNENDAILVDVGISCTQTEKRMQRLGLSMDKVKAIFVSHEHSDHIIGVPQLARKYQIPVFISSPTLRVTRFPLEQFPIQDLQAYEPIWIGELRVTAFPKLHDAADPHSFLVSYRDTNVGVFTDIGMPCDHVIHHFQQCHAVFLEANYDEELLENSRYPYFLKRRIQGEKGHLSNQQALALLKEHKPEFMSHILLSHLSKDNNCPQLVHDLFTANVGDAEIVVASRLEETPVYTIRVGRFANDLTSIG